VVVGSALQALVAVNYLVLWVVTPVVVVVLASPVLSTAPVVSVVAGSPVVAEALPEPPPVAESVAEALPVDEVGAVSVPKLVTPVALVVGSDVAALAVSRPSSPQASGLRTRTRRARRSEGMSPS